MTLLVDSPAVAARFDRICAAIAADRRGLTLTDLGHAHRLARELEKSADPKGGNPGHHAERVADLAAKLGLEVGALG